MPDRAERRAAALAARRSAVGTLLIAAATAAVVALGGGEAVWLTVPAALLAAGAARGRVAGGLSGALVVGAAIAAERAVTARATEPAIALLVLVPAASVTILVAVRERLERERDLLRASALSDPLTGVANRRALLARIEYEIARHARTRHSFAVLMLDLNGFKQLNDRFGIRPGTTCCARWPQVWAGRFATRTRSPGWAATSSASWRRKPTRRARHGWWDGWRRQSRGWWRASRRSAPGSARRSTPHDGTSPAELLEAADQKLLGAKRQTGRRGGAHTRSRRVA